MRSSGPRQKQAHFLGQKFCAHLVHLGDVQPLQNVPAAEDGVDVAGIEPQLAQNIPRAAVVEGVFEDLVADDGENPVKILPLVVRLGEHGVQKPKLGQKHLSAAAKAETHIIDGGVAVDFGAARGHFGIDFGCAALARPLEEHMLDEVVYPGRRLGHEGQDDGKGDRIQPRRAEGNQPRPVFQRLIFFRRKIHGIPSLPQNTAARHSRLRIAESGTGVSRAAEPLFRFIVTHSRRFVNFRRKIAEKRSPSSKGRRAVYSYKLYFLYYTAINCIMSTNGGGSMNEFGEFPKILRGLRQSSGCTQQDVAQKLGIAYQSYQAYERGVALPTLKNFVAIADLFDVSLDYLLGRKEL